MEVIDLSYGLIDHDLPRAAPDDLSLITGQFPFEASRTAVFLRNNNITRGIVAAVRVDGVSGMRVQSLDRTVSQARWPLRFEARVAPGSVLLVAPATVDHVHGLYPDHIDVVTVNQQVIIEGAYYRDPPYPNDPAPESFARIYSAPIHGGDEWDSLDLMVNLHNSRVITITASPVPGDEGLRMGTVLPGLHLLWDQWKEPRAWRVSEAKYFP